MALQDYLDENKINAFRQDQQAKGRDMTQVDKYLQQKQNEARNAMAVTGGLDITALPTESRASAFVNAQSMGYKPKGEEDKLTETQNKFALGLDAARKARKLLEEGQSTGPLSTYFQKVGEKFGGTEGTDFRSNLALANTALKSAFLGTGQSSKEIEGLIDAISNPYQQEEVLKVKLDQLIDIVSGRIPGEKDKPSLNLNNEKRTENNKKEMGVDLDLGTNPQEQIQQRTPEWKNAYQQSRKKYETMLTSSPSLSLESKTDLYDKVYNDRNFMTEVLVGDSLDLGKDIIAGAQMKGKTGEDLFKTMDAAVELANIYMTKAEKATDPDRRALFDTVATKLLDQTIENGQAINNMFSEKIDDSTLGRSLGVGVEIATLADLPSFAKSLWKMGTKFLARGGAEVAAEATSETAAKAASKTDVPGKVVKVVEKAKRLTPSGWLAKKQAGYAAKVTQKVDTQKIVQFAIKDLRMNAQATEELAKLTDDVAKIENVSDLLRKLQDWGSSAYLKGGGVRAGNKADAMEALYKGGMETLKEVAPEVYNYRRILGYSIKYGGKSGKWLWRAFLAKAVFGGLGS